MVVNVYRGGCEGNVVGPCFTCRGDVVTVFTRDLKKIRVDARKPVNLDTFFQVPGCVAEGF